MVASTFSDATIELIAKHGATHGVQWVDFDGDGGVDLALANNNATGGHYLFRNKLPSVQKRRSIQVSVVDEQAPRWMMTRKSSRTCTSRSTRASKSAASM